MIKIQLEKISKTYGENKHRVEALKNINLQIHEGEAVAIMGRSGSGKSTLLNVMGGLTGVNEGSYHFDEKLLKSTEQAMCQFRNKEIGFIVQNYALLYDRTVYQNIELPIKFSRLNKKSKRMKIESILNEVELLNKQNRFPSELSGGECQRVAIARALVNDASVILADEPTGALDETTEKTIMNIFKKLNKKGKTIIIVTHDNSIANQLDRVIKLKDGKLMEFSNNEE